MAKHELLRIIHRDLEGEKVATAISDFASKTIGDGESLQMAARNLPRRYQSVIAVCMEVATVPTYGDLEATLHVGKVANKLSTIPVDTRIIPRGSGPGVIVSWCFVVMPEWYAVKISNKSATADDNAVITSVDIYELHNVEGDATDE